MATTFKMSNGDVVMNTSNGRPKTIGNPVGEEDRAKSREKTIQDLRRGLSLERVRNGTTAALQNLVGSVPQFGSTSIAILINRQIRSMFSFLIKEQRKRPNIRPKSERFSSISRLQVLPEGNKTDFRFRLGVRTADKGVTETSGVVG